MNALSFQIKNSIRFDAYYKKTVSVIVAFALFCKNNSMTS